MTAQSLRSQHSLEPANLGAETARLGEPVPPCEGTLLAFTDHLWDGTCARVPSYGYLSSACAQALFA